MNDYMKGHIDACDKIYKDATEFKTAVKKVTGLTESGFHGIKYAVAIYKTKGAQK